LESDVQRVESILQEKDGQISDLQKESQSLRESNEKMGEEKKILIEAIFEKDMVIREYEAKLRELIESKIHTPSSIPTPQSS
jgi:peptidoglycan hydrolase CwlO-like protein